MIKNLTSTFVSLTIGFVVGILVTIFIYPFLFPPAQVNEQITNKKEKTIIAKGKFYDQSMTSRVHWGRGNVSVYHDTAGYIVFLNKNFQVGPGPAFHVYADESLNIRDNAGFKKSTSYDLGILKSFRGSQIYRLPSHVPFSRVRSIVIWCKSFKQYITSADLIKNSN